MTPATDRSLSAIRSRWAIPAPIGAPGSPMRQAQDDILHLLTVVKGLRLVIQGVEAITDGDATAREYAMFKAREALEATA